MRFPRRTVLRAGSSAVAIPLLPSLGFVRGASAAAEAARPKRLMFLAQGYGNAWLGAHNYLPDRKQVGRDYTLTPSMEPLAKHKDKVSIIQGLLHRDSVVAHWSSTYWLTGANRYGKAGSSFHNTISADQVAARKWGVDTRYASLQFDTANAYYICGHGAGLSLAWDDEGKPLPGMENPVVAFHKLFSADGGSLEERQAAIADGRSVLDAIREDIADVKRDLSPADADKFDEYVQGIREIEGRLARDERWLTVPKPASPGVTEPKEGLLGVDEINIMYDLMVAALRTDLTRVVTYRQPVQSIYQSLGLKLQIDAHELTHDSTPAGQETAAARDKKQCELVAGLIDRLLAVKEPDGSSLFDHTTAVFGGNVRTGHDLFNVPTLVFGRGAGLTLGEQFNYPDADKTPLCNLWLSILQGSGVEATSFGDSRRPLDELRAT